MKRITTVILAALATMIIASPIQAENIITFVTPSDTPDHGPSALKVMQQSHQTWPGIDFVSLDPDWDIDTVFIVTPTGVTPITPSGLFTGSINGSIGGFGAFFQFNGNPIFNQILPPIELLESTQSAQTDTQATVNAYGETFQATRSDSDSSSSPGPFEAEFPQIAFVFDDAAPSNLLIAGRAWATQTSDITINQMTASGSVSTDSLRDTGVPDANADASATSEFSSSFRLNESHDFTLDIEVSVTENVSLTVSLTDDLNQNTLYSAVPADFDEQTGTWQILVEGYLPPGEYTLHAGALSDALTDTHGGQDFGGDALFDLEFNLTQVDSPAASAFLQANATVPEPATLMMLALAAWPLVCRRR